MASYFEGDSHAAFTGQLLALLQQATRPGNQDVLVPIHGVTIVDDEEGNHRNIIEVAAGSRIFRIVVADVTDA